MFGFVFSFGWECWSFSWFFGPKDFKRICTRERSAWSLLQYAVLLMRSQIVLEYILIDKI